MMTLDEILLFITLVFHRFVREHIQCDCFLTKDIAAVFLISQDPQHRAAAPNRFIGCRGDSAACQYFRDLRGRMAIEIHVVYDPYQFGLIFHDHPMAFFVHLIAEERPCRVNAGAALPSSDV